MRFAVTGGRTFKDRELVKQVLSVFPKGSHVVVGDAGGADALAIDLSLELGLLLHIYNADWEGQGRSAGPIRNAKMLEEDLDFVIAFPGGKGTENMVKQANKKGILVLRVEPKEEKNGKVRYQFNRK